MVWGAIKEDGTRILIRCPDRMYSVGYEDVLKRGLLLIYTISFNRTVHHAINPDLLLLFWKTLRSTCSVIGRRCGLTWKPGFQVADQQILRNFGDLVRSNMAMIPVPKVKFFLSKHSFEDLRGFEEERTEYMFLITCVTVGDEVFSS